MLAGPAEGLGSAFGLALRRFRPPAPRKDPRVGNSPGRGSVYYADDREEPGRARVRSRDPGPVGGWIPVDLTARDVDRPPRTRFFDDLSLPQAMGVLERLRLPGDGSCGRRRAGDSLFRRERPSGPGTRGARLLRARGRVRELRRVAHPIGDGRHPLPRGTCRFLHRRAGHRGPRGTPFLRVSRPVDGVRLGGGPSPGVSGGPGCRRPCFPSGA